MNERTWCNLQMHVADEGLLFTSYWMDNYYVHLVKGQYLLGL